MQLNSLFFCHLNNYLITYENRCYNVFYKELYSLIFGHLLVSFTTFNLL